MRYKKIKMIEKSNNLWREIVHAHKVHNQLGSDFNFDFLYRSKIKFLENIKSKIVSDIINTLRGKLEIEG